ncbi:Ig-like domain-containing protein, partial [Vibrio vulnificus]|uniref:Ig-like domain-containing protein n=1 Tax=Vibrio vulnificus TaxID=672 RepID=UPI0024DFE0AD
MTGDNQVDDSEDKSVTLSGSTTGIEAGQTVSVSVVDASGTEVYSNTATVQADGSWSISGGDMSGFADDANYTVRADVSDAAGNAATQAMQAFTTEDTTAGTISINA